MFEAEYAIQRNQNDAQYVIQIEGRIDLARICWMILTSRSRR